MIYVAIYYYFGNVIKYVLYVLSGKRYKTRLGRIDLGGSGYKCTEVLLHLYIGTIMRLVRASVHIDGM